jgi:hypothetical protein
MESFIPFQELLTVRLGAAGEIIQNREGYLDLVEEDSVFVRVEVFSLTAGAILSLDTAVEDGLWVSSEQWAGILDGAKTIDETVNLKTYSSAEFPLARYLRWSFRATGAASVTFRLTYRVARKA